MYTVPVNSGKEVRYLKRPPGKAVAARVISRNNTPAPLLPVLQSYSCREGWNFNATQPPCRHGATVS